MEQIREYIESILTRCSSDYLYLAGIIVIAVIAIVLPAMLISYLTSKNGIIGDIKSIVKKAANRESLRKAILNDSPEDLIIEEKTGLIKRLDIVLHTSGLKRKLPWLSTELYILLTVGLVIISCVITLIISKNSTFGILAGISVIALSWILLTTLTAINHAAVSKDLPLFLNLVQNNAPQFKSLYQIFDHIAPYMSPTLKSALLTCSTKARLTGDEALAISELKQTLHHDKMSDILVNLEIASSYSSDYGNAIEELRDALMSELRHKKEVRNKKISASITWSIIFVMGYYCLTQLNTTIPQIAKTPVGGIMLIYLGVLMIFNIYNILSAIK